MFSESDKHEVLDMVKRKGPISLDGLMDQLSMYSEDDVFIALVELEDDGAVRRFEGDPHEHGTTKDLWEQVE
jgi:hypothetical protein